MHSPPTAATALARRITLVIQADADPPMSEWVVGFTPRELAQVKYRVALAEAHERRPAFRQALAAAGQELSRAIAQAEVLL